MEVPKSQMNTTEMKMRKRRKCNLCEFTCTSESILKKHIESTHENMTQTNTTNSKRIKCQLCDKKFNKAETHKAHMKKVHSLSATSVQKNSPNDKL